MIAAELQGEPSETNCDVVSVDDPSFWRYEDILPNIAYAVAQVAHCPNAVAFDPHKIAFTNTTTIFAPTQQAADVPFDLLFMSNVYVFFSALAARMGVLRQCRSHMYPTNVGLLPWSENLVRAAGEIEALRSRLVSACGDAARGHAALLDAISSAGVADGQAVDAGRQGHAAQLGRWLPAKRTPQ